MAPRTATSISTINSQSSLFTTCSSCLKREFSSSQAPQTRLRRAMFAWLEGPGESFRHPLPNSTNYLSAYDRRGKLLREGEDTKESRSDLQPFPLNNHFISESILSEPLRQEIWHRVQNEKKSVRTVSVELGVEMRRVGAVVRLVELENQIKAQKKPMALPYARAIHEMVPTTPFNPGQAPIPHEPINDLPVHSLTTPQIFYPTSESRAFNRTDAGRVFSAAPRLPDSQDRAQGGTPVEPYQDTKLEKVGRGENEIDVLKPADARIPHPHMIAYAKDQNDPSMNRDHDLIKQRYNQRLLEDAQKRITNRDKRFAADEKQRTRIDTKRWEFIVTDVSNSHNNNKAPGVRYGVPHEDRKKGQVKIPTKVAV